MQEGLYVVGLLGYIFWLNWRLASVFIVVSPLIAWLAALTFGAIAGALKKKLGLKVESEKVADRGRVYRIAE